ncbi:MAG: cobalt transporter [Gammaproteobacteria bacterium]|jgi:cobalt transporter subunit CbtA|nr:cobalt transporter [Gammaproteobacteria bacterium]
MLRETILSAVVAGIVAALLLTTVQSVWVTPLILQGETYEDAAEAAVSHHDSAPSSAGHHHDPAAWKPQDGLQRTMFTFGANLLMGVGYAFVLVAFYLLWREPKSALWGAAYGLAGFVVFFAAPGMGLPPELPGTAAAELTVRQEWWVLTAVATGAGLILFFSISKWWVRVLALALLVAPHLIPAPQPAVQASLAPEELQSRFRLATTLCNAVFWLSLGLASSIAFRKMVPANAHARG